MTRPSIDTTELIQGAEAIDEKPQAEIGVQAPRAFLFDLLNGQKYYADKGYFRLVVLKDGTYLDVSSIAWATSTNEYGDQRTEPANVGSMLLPLPPETDWVIQDLIDPKRASNPVQ